MDSLTHALRVMGGGQKEQGKNKGGEAAFSLTPGFLVEGHGRHFFVVHSRHIKGSQQSRFLAAWIKHSRLTSSGFISRPATVVLPPRSPAPQRHEDKHQAGTSACKEQSSEGVKAALRILGVRPGRVSPCLPVFPVSEAATASSEGHSQLPEVARIQLLTAAGDEDKRPFFRRPRRQKDEEVAFLRSCASFCDLHTLISTAH